MAILAGFTFGMVAGEDKFTAGMNRARKQLDKLSRKTAQVRQTIHKPKREKQWQP